MAVQLAVADGARVIGTASENEQERLRGLGVEPVVYGDGLLERIRALAPRASRPLSIWSAPTKRSTFPWPSSRTANGSRRLSLLPEVRPTAYKHLAAVPELTRAKKSARRRDWS